MLIIESEKSIHQNMEQWRITLQGKGFRISVSKTLYGLPIKPLVKGGPHSNRIMYELLILLENDILNCNIQEVGKSECRKKVA